MVTEHSAWYHPRPSQLTSRIYFYTPFNGFIFVQNFAEFYFRAVYPQRFRKIFSYLKNSYYGNKLFELKMKVDVFTYAATRQKHIHRQREITHSPKGAFFRKIYPIPSYQKTRIKLGSVLKKINPRKTNHVFEKLKVVLNDIDRYFDAQNFKYHKMQ